RMKTREDKSLWQKLLEEDVLSDSMAQESNGEEKPQYPIQGVAENPAHGALRRKEPPCTRKAAGTLARALTWEHLHTKEKPYKCFSECGKSFSNSSNLLIHQWVREGKWPCECEECGESSILICHQKAHTGKQSYQCLECGKNFSECPHLICHQKVHTGDPWDPCECPKCGKSF
ncbi:ZKSC7 protein, partial [Certhia familiaris]|nr:ZKSC7 protein [Certhia familiaris]